MWGLIPIADGPVIIIKEGYYKDKSSKENFEFSSLFLSMHNNDL